MQLKAANDLNNCCQGTVPQGFVVAGRRTLPVYGSPANKPVPPIQMLWHSSARWKLDKVQRPIELGSKLFLWRKGNANGLLISAHGGVRKGTPSIVIPAGVTIHFYSRHGEEVADPGLVLPDEDHVHHTGNGKNRVANYELTKYQTAAGETYQQIAGKVAENRFDVLTVRDRWFGKSVTLQEALTAVQPYRYTDIYLSACRVTEDFRAEDVEMLRQDMASMGYGQISDEPDEPASSGSSRPSISLPRWGPTGYQPVSQTPVGEPSEFSFINET